MIVGDRSHILLWEQGGASQVNTISGAVVLTFYLGRRLHVAARTKNRLFPDILKVYIYAKKTKTDRRTATARGDELAGRYAKHG